MAYLVFDTLEQAQTAQTQIDANILSLIMINDPESVSETGIIGRNANTGELDFEAARTTTWSIPTEFAQGWYLIKPDQVDLLEGVEGFVEYSELPGIDDIVIATLK